MSRFLSILQFTSLLAFYNCGGQTTSDSARSSQFINTDWDDYNLNGRVKSLEYALERHYPLDTFSFEEEKQFEAANYFSLNDQVLGYIRFDSIGFRTEQQYFVRDSAVVNHIQIASNASRDVYYFENDPSNLLKLPLSPIHSNQHFPVFSPYYQNQNYFFYSQAVWLEDSTYSDTTYIFYEYSLDESGRIEEEVKSNQYAIRHRKKNYFDEDDRVIEQSFIFSENSYEELRAVDRIELNHRQSVGGTSDTRYLFKYDDQDRITEAKLTSNGRVRWSENYFYEGASLKPSKLDRYLNSKGTAGFFFSDNATEYFNDKGDCIKSEYFDNQGNLIRTRHYEYEYDEVGNWIRCDMYLAGSVEKAAKPTITARRKITYYY